MSNGEGGGMMGMGEAGCGPMRGETERVSVVVGGGW